MIDILHSTACVIALYKIIEADLAVCVQLAWVQAVRNIHLALSCTEKIINSWEHHAGLILHIFRYINVMVVSSNCCIFLLT